VRAENVIQRSASRAAVVKLGDPRALDPGMTGAKASALARAAAAGFPVLPGFAIATSADVDRDLDAIEGAWSRLSSDGTALIVRSSSTVEDAVASSMAGRFRTVVGVVGWEAFIDAVREVRGSASSLSEIEAPMAVLVQPMLDPVRGGVVFGVDPVTGDRRRFVVESVHGSPKALVDGVATASHITIHRSGVWARRAGADRGETRPSRVDLFRLAALTRRAERFFGVPQDIEWAVDGAHHLWLLQSRPVTAVGEATEATGPALGPGPIGETFPQPLAPLEEDLFLDPLREGIVGALRAVGAVSSARIDASPIALTIGGRVAADLELLGFAPRRRAVWRAVDPRRGARRLAAAWHTGRLRLAMPGEAAALLERTDDWLTCIPALSTLGDDALLALLEDAAERLRGLHGHQVLAGMLLPAEEHGPGAAPLAIDAISTGRARGERDEEVVAEAPVTLALAPPRIAPVPELPDVVTVGHGRSVPVPLSAIGAREALRVRARWVDELVARVAWSLGSRLERSGRLRYAGDVRFLRRAEVAQVVHGGPVPDDLAARAAARPGPPLPASFRLTPGGAVVPEPDRGCGDRGVPAGGGRGSGLVRSTEVAGPGDVLVVDVLAPALATKLPGLAGLVSETGSALSHLAILAREMGVPTVVAVAGARRRFPEGSRVVVDGLTGEVALVDDEGAGP
jgi:phosphohistidine swiveling domain-containing protein